MDRYQSKESALEAANLALSNTRPAVSRGLASIELRDSGNRKPHPNAAAWEGAATVAVGFGALLVVLGIWFL